VIEGITAAVAPSEEPLCDPCCFAVVVGHTNPRPHSPRDAIGLTALRISQSCKALKTRGHSRVR
jgi:hypothetical protein